MALVPIAFFFALTVAASPDAQVEATIRTYVDAVRTYDAATLDKVFDPEYTEISPLGELDDRARTLSFYQIPADKRGPMPTSIEVKDVKLRFPAKGLALATYIEVVRIENSGRTLELNFRASSLLRERKGTWKFISNTFHSLRKPSS